MKWLESVTLNCWMHPDAYSKFFLDEVGGELSRGWSCYGKLCYLKCWTSCWDLPAVQSACILGNLWAEDGKEVRKQARSQIWLLRLLVAAETLTGVYSICKCPDVGNWRQRRQDLGFREKHGKRISSQFSSWHCGWRVLMGRRRGGRGWEQVAVSCWSLICWQKGLGRWPWGLSWDQQTRVTGSGKCSLCCPLPPRSLIILSKSYFHLVLPFLFTFPQRWGRNPGTHAGWAGEPVYGRRHLLLSWSSLTW